MQLLFHLHPQCFPERQFWVRNFWFNSLTYLLLLRIIRKSIQANTAETMILIVITRLPSAVETGKKGIEQTKVETVEVVPVQETVIVDPGPDLAIDGQDPVRDHEIGHRDPEGSVIVIDHLGVEIGAEIEMQVDVIETVIVIIVVTGTVIGTDVIELLKVMKRRVMFRPTIP